jgi:hypothetical protein
MQRINDQILMKDAKLQELKVAGRKLMDDKQVWQTGAKCANMDSVLLLKFIGKWRSLFTQ